MRCSDHDHLLRCWQTVALRYRVLKAFQCKYSGNKGHLNFCCIEPNNPFPEQAKTVQANKNRPYEPTLLTLKTLLWYLTFQRFYMSGQVLLCSRALSVLVNFKVHGKYVKKSSDSELTRSYMVASLELAIL